LHLVGYIYIYIYIYNNNNNNICCCWHNILSQGVFVTKRSDAGISVWRIVWVATNCRLMGDIWMLSSQVDMPGFYKWFCFIRVSPPIFCMYFCSPLTATCLAHPILLDLLPGTILNEYSKSQRFSLGSHLQPPATFSVSDPNAFRSSFSSNSPNCVMNV